MMHLNERGAFPLQVKCFHIVNFQFSNIAGMDLGYFKRGGHYKNMLSSKRLRDREEGVARGEVSCKKDQV